MGLKKLSSNYSSLRQAWFVSFVLFTFLLVGCGGGEEVTTESPQTQTVKPAPAVEQEKPIDQALTSFIGDESEKSNEPMPVAVLKPSQLAQYEKQIDDLRTENTGLKQKIVKLEQENRDINKHLSEVEAKTAADRMQIGAGVSAPSAAVVMPTTSDETVDEVTSNTYENSLQAFKARRYEAASRGFKALVDGTDDEMARRATYWLGESYFAMKKYKEALPLFQETINQRNSAKKPDAQFMIAQTYERLGNKVKAKAAYEKVVKNYPMSKNVKRAKQRWAKL